jgi:DNA-binding MarR family transcriptional regulator
MNTASLLRNFMDLQAQRDLQLLQEVERNSGVTQRTLAKTLGVAVGLTNLYIKRLVRKGHIKITTIPRNRLKYLLTPRGMTEKSRLTYQYMQYSLSYYRKMRQRLQHVFSDLTKAGAKRIVIYGTGELAELAYLTLCEMDLTLVGFVDGERERTFLSFPLWPTEALAQWDFDAVLMADLTDPKKAHARLLSAGVPKNKIVAVCPLPERSDREKTP